MNSPDFFSDVKIRLDGRIRAMDYIQMLKLHLCLYISLAGIAGYVMAQNGFSQAALPAGGLLLLLSMGSAVLNNIQDRDYDRSFSRTCLRSLPCRRVPLHHARVMAAVLISAGLSGLSVLAAWPGFLSGLAAVICYNGLYTPLKKRTLLAIIPGTLSGMMPVMIGWTIAGQPYANPILAILLVILGLWQVPHFFIILLKNSKEKNTQHPIPPYPCFTALLSYPEMRLQVLIWTSLYSLGIFLLLTTNAIDHPWMAAIMSANALAILAPATVLVINPRKFNLTFAFAAINLSMLVFLGAGICDKAVF